MKLYINILSGLYLIFSSFLFISCEDDLDLQPLDQLSKETFWKSESDATLALMALYNSQNRGSGELNLNHWPVYVEMDCTVDIGRRRTGSFRHFYSGTVNSANGSLRNLWGGIYEIVARTNNFLENIDLVEGMPVELVSQMKAEAKFIRAYHYFWLVHLWGDVPLTTQSITIDEANTIARTPRVEVINYVLSELTEAANNLPVIRPDEEKGRIVKAAAMAIKGRMMMSEKRWSDAATEFKGIIDLGNYELYPDYEVLFTARGEDNKETIHSIRYLENDYASSLQRYVTPFVNAGWHMAAVYNEFVESFPCTDGLPIDESPLYDEDNPFENRDPRLYASCHLDGFSVFQGQLFRSHPDSAGAPDRLPRRDWTGIGLKKFADEAYTGNNQQHGTDFNLIRYAEVLLSYLESKLEAGDPIDQGLLDLTINQIRQRPSVNLPGITETNPELLREIVRNERKIELGFEGLRLFDLLRWRIAHEVCGNNTPFHGVKLTNDPQNYNGQFNINENGYYFYRTRNFRDPTDYLLPIPQSEMDIHFDWQQNPGY